MSDGNGNDATSQGKVAKGAQDDHNNSSINKSTGVDGVKLEKVRNSIIESYSRDKSL